MDKNAVLFNTYNQTYLGLIDLSENVRRYATSLPEKLEAMEAAYLKTNLNYSGIEQERMEYFRKAFTYKFHLATMDLEQLWSLQHMEEHMPPLKDVLHNVFDFHECHDDRLLLPSFALEGFIIQGSAFLDFYMLYLCTIFRIKDTHRLSPKKFLKAFDQNIDPVHQSEAAKVKTYFENHVFDQNKSTNVLADNWGNFLRDLRNSLVHRDNLQPDFQNRETLFEKITGTWPTSEIDVTFSRFCQDFNNAMFGMLVKLASITYGLEWKPDAYKVGMW